MIDLYSIFKSITPENIQDIPLVKVCMQTFAEHLQENTQVAQRISAIYEDYSDDDSDMIRSSKDNLKTGLYVLYTNTLYNACAKAQQDPEILKILKKFNYTENAITEDLNTLINSEFLGAQRQFSQTVGTEKALHYMYSFAKYLETGYVRDDLEISKRDPFIVHYEGSLNKRTFETVVYPQAHPLGWAYSYTTVITQALRDYYGIQMIYHVKKLWLVNYSEGKYIVFTDKTQEEIYDEFRNIINPNTQTFFTDEEIARQVTIYTERTVTDFQRWEDEKGNWCQLFTFDDDMVLYHDGTKGITYYTSYEDYIDGCKEPQNVWDSNYQVVADIIQDIKFEYFDTQRFEKLFEVTRVRDTDHKVGDSEYMEDDVTRAFSITGTPYLYNQGVDESVHKLIKEVNDVPVGGNWLPRPNGDRLRDLEVISNRMLIIPVSFDGKTYEVVGYQDELYVPEFIDDFEVRLKNVEDIILPLRFIRVQRNDDTIELIVSEGSSIPSGSIDQRLEKLEDIVNSIQEVKVTWDDGNYNLLRRLASADENIYKLKFKQDYIGNIRIYASGYLEVDDQVKDVQEYEFDTTYYHGHEFHVVLTDLLGNVQEVKTNTLNKTQRIFIRNCLLSTYGKYITSIYDKDGIITDIDVPTDKGPAKKFGLTVYGKVYTSSSEEAFVLDEEVFDHYPFADSNETVYLELEDENGSTLYAQVRTDIVGNFIYTFDTSTLNDNAKSSHKFRCTAYTKKGKNIQDSCYYEGNWLNDFDKTPVYVEVPEFKALISHNISYELGNISTDQMIGIENSLLDVTNMDDDKKAKLLQNRLQTVEEIDSEAEDLQILEKELYRNFDYIGEKVEGYYRPDQWAADYLNPNYEEDGHLYLDYSGYLTGNIIEGENYYRSSWEFYPEEEVFINQGFRRQKIGTSDYYIMTSTRFVTDDFQITCIGDDYYLYTEDGAYVYTTDEQYIVTDEDDVFPDAWGIKTEDGMDRHEWEILYEHNGVVLKDFTGFEDILVPSKRYIDAYSGEWGSYDSVEVTIKGEPGKEVQWECIGDGLFAGDPNDPVSQTVTYREENTHDGAIVQVPVYDISVDRSYVSRVKTVIDASGKSTVRVYSREPFTQSLLIRASYQSDVQVKDEMPDTTGIYNEDGSKYTIPQTYHTETMTFTHKCYIMYHISQYELKCNVPRYITPDGYTLRYYSLMPKSPVIEKEPMLITGTSTGDGSFLAVHKPYNFNALEVIHSIKYYNFGVHQEEVAFSIPFVDMHFTGDREIINAFDPEVFHVSVPGYAYADLTGCRDGERLTFEPLGDCYLEEVPAYADSQGKARVKVVAKAPFIENPGVRVLTHQFDIIKEVHFVYNEKEVFPTMTLPTLKNIYGTFKNTIDTDTDYVISAYDLLKGSIVELIEGNKVVQTKEATNGTVDFICPGVDYRTLKKEYKIKYRSSGKNYDFLTGSVDVYQYRLSSFKRKSDANKDGIDAFYMRYLNPDNKEVSISGGKPFYSYKTTLMGDGVYTTTGSFDSAGNALVALQSKKPWTANISLTVESQGQKTNTVIAHELSVYTPTIVYGHFNPDVYYYPIFVSYKGVSGIEISDIEEHLEHGELDYNTVYLMKYKNLKPNKDVTIKIGSKVQTVRATDKGEITFMTDKVQDYSQKTILVEMTYQTKTSQEVQDQTSEEYSMKEYTITGTSAKDILGPEETTEVTFTGLRDGEVPVFSAQGGKLVSHDNIVKNGTAKCVVKSEYPYFGGITATCTILEHCEGHLVVPCFISPILTSPKEIIENDEEILLTLSGGVKGDDCSFRIEGDAEIIEADANFRSDDCAYVKIKGIAPYLTKVKVTAEAYGLEIPLELDINYTVWAYRSPSSSFGTGKQDGTVGEVYPASEIFLEYSTTNQSISLKDHPPYGSAFECVEASKVYYYYESVPHQTWVPSVYRTVSYGGYRYGTYQQLVREGYYTTTYTNERKKLIVKGKFKRV